jgi:hypothetical protein
MLDCGTSYSGKLVYGDHGGPYAMTGTMPCSYYPYYDRWSFYASSDAYAYVTVDTVADTTKFDPDLVVTDSSSCILGNAYNTFTCSYPPASGSCASYVFPVSKGQSYDVMVLTHAGCASSTGEYELSIDLPSDPGLTLMVDDKQVQEDVHIQISGNATL